jgi:hypothetical protein
MILKLKEVTTLIPFENNQLQLVSLIFIPKGTILMDSMSVVKPKRGLSTFMNDADFEYPASFLSELLIKSSFVNYLKRKNNSKCNISKDNKTITVLKDIQIGDPLTYRYGLMDWMGYIMVDIYHKKSPFHDFIPIQALMITTEEEKIAETNLINALKFSINCCNQEFKTEYHNENALELLAGKYTS